ncbi:MAG: hypothetical protein AB7H96_08945 [Vicinamibacterales bacterium]
MRLQVLSALVAGCVLLARPAHADVHITIADGRVTLSAKDATIRQILAEWARVGQTRIVNAERVSGAPLSMELTDVPEAQALDTVLRSVSGYLAAPRQQPARNTSAYDRIYLLPTSSGTPARTASSGPQTQPGFTPPAFPPPQVDEDPDEMPQPPVQPAVVQPNGPRGPQFPTTPPPFQGRQAPVPPAPQPAAMPMPAQGPTPFGFPTGASGAAGVATPGMVVPVPRDQQDQDGGDRR